MKLRLIIMRHAKSSWNDAALSDHDRPLNKRGKKDAPQIAKVLAEFDWIPELIISSSANRTIQTFERMLPEWKQEPEIRIQERFYGGGYQEIINALEDVEETFLTILVLGHNPGWENAINAFTNEYIAMKTSNAALLEIEARDWMEATTRNGFQLRGIARPE